MDRVWAGVFGICVRERGLADLVAVRPVRNYAATEGVAKAFVADLVPDAQRGAAYGWFNAAIGITALPASLLAGLLWQGLGQWAGFGPSAPFLFGAALALVAGILLWRVIK